MAKTLKKILSLMLVAVLVSTVTASTKLVVAADEVTVDKVNISDLAIPEDDNLLEYSEYAKENANINISKENILVSGNAFVSESESGAVSAEYAGKSNALLWESGKGSVTWEITVEEDGLYNFAISFIPLKNSTNLELGFYLDGAVPFKEAKILTITSDWVNASDKWRVDKLGNEIAPEQVMSSDYSYRLATDITGVALDPFTFALKAGKHTVTLDGMGYAVAIAEIGFSVPSVTKPYKTVSSKYNVVENLDVEPIIIHAEDASVKNDNSLIPKSTNGNAGMYPVDAFLTKINNIGGGSWTSPGQEITWNFTVKKAGYYSFGARYKQNELVGGESWRILKIDGKSPFDEAKELRFNYDTGWQYFELGNEKEPYYIYLDEGEHTLSLEVTLGELSEFYDRLNKAVTALGDMYLEIVMITGETPDTNRDYELFNQIPEFTEVLTDVSKELNSIVEDMKNLTGNNGSQYTSAMNNMNRVINKMLDAKFIAHLYVKDYYTNYTTLSSWLNEMKKMPLALDEMQFVYAGQEFDWNQPNIFEKMWFGFKRLLYSYVSDYASTGNNKDKDDVTLKLWVNWGRDQTMALDSLIRESFTAETGINVELQIVSNSLINGLLANNFPDVQLHLSRTAPVNYGMRGALLDLTQFSDYEEVLNRFQKGADTPYWYNDALYALPDTQSFFTMFYRTDVFEQLELEVPKTWEEFLYCATIIQRYNMGVYVPYTQIATTTTVNAGIGNLNLYPTLMMQSNISLYNKELNATNLITPEGINVFEEWTEMYTDYGYLKEADFYNRFRNGSMPLGIAPYSTYLTIYSAAPEIQGRWSIANVPGNANGNNLVAGGGTGCSIVKESKHHKEAWEFLKWWTSAETQTRYSNNVESILGMLGRVSTANVEAFKNLSWNPNDLEKLMNQWDSVNELPEVPGSYYLTRAVDQAFWSVINDGYNSKDAITEWSQVADNEIARKIKEYS